MVHLRQVLLCAAVAACAAALAPSGGAANAKKADAKADTSLRSSHGHGFQVVPRAGGMRFQEMGVTLESTTEMEKKRRRRAHGKSHVAEGAKTGVKQSQKMKKGALLGMAAGAMMGAGRGMMGGMMGLGRMMPPQPVDFPPRGVGMAPMGFGQFVPFGKAIPRQPGVNYYTASGLQECAICKQVIQASARYGNQFYGLCQMEKEYLDMCHAQQKVLQACPEFTNNWCYQDMGGSQVLKSPCPSHLICHYCLGMSPLHCVTREVIDMSTGVQYDGGLK